MTLIKQLRAPIIAAPMAGGPSTPALVQAVGKAGGFGFLAVGTMSVADAQEQIDECRTGCAAANIAFGVNLFHPQIPLTDLEPVRDIAHELGVYELPEVDYDFGYSEKLDAIIEARPAVASVMFGPFSADEIVRLHAAGIEAWITVTNPNDAVTAAGLGADAIIVQGPKAGGHRGTWSVEETPDERDLDSLLEDVSAALGQAELDVAVAAAGGITDASIGHFASRADAVVCGSAFLLADEAGTKSLSRELLIKGGESVSTRAFSGRFARGLSTPFTRAHESGTANDIGAVYPYLNKLLAPRRSEPDYAYCLVGSDWNPQPRPAAEIFAELESGLAS